SFSPSPGSTSKAGGVRFPDDDEPPGSPTRRDDQSNLSTLVAVQEKDGSYLVKVCAGFLKSHHCYEIVFTVPDVPSLGKELTCLPSLSPTRRAQNLRIQRINSMLEVTCVITMLFCCLYPLADPHHGTPMLLEGVRCLGAQRDPHARRSSERKRI
uniref:Uncharacterized protein n=1 Tax=Xiphophorus couchianus TaxID=32473 RepID=A0A3B5LSG3_9TELE